MARICRKSQNLPNSPGFTRIDLVASVAGIILLTALAASALSGGRDNANRVVCDNNMREMGLACAMYANDNRDYFAFANFDDSEYANEGPSSPGWLYTMNPNGRGGNTQAQIGGGKACPSPFSAVYSNTPQSAWASGVWFPYVQNYQYYLCPVDIQSSTYTSHERSDLLSSYVMNGAVIFYGEGPNSHAPPWTTCKLSDVWNSACYLMWNPDEYTGSEGEFNDGCNFPGNGGLEQVAPLHGNNGGDVVTVGGGVTFVFSSTFTALGDENQGPNLAWWSPANSRGH